MMDRERSREGFRYDSHTFALKKDVIALQCADFLAWHWGKAVKIRAEGGKPREDLRALWEGGGRRFYCQHYDKEKLMALSTEAIEYQKNRKWNSKTQSWEEN